MNLIRAISALMLLASSSMAAQGYTLGPTISTTTGRASQSLAGTYNLAAGSTTVSTATIILNGQTGGVNASSITVRYGLVASSSTVTTLTANGDATFNGQLNVGSGGNIQIASGGEAIIFNSDLSKLDMLGGDVFFNTSDALRNGVILKTMEPGDAALTSLEVQNTSFTITASGHSSTFTATGTLVVGSSITASAFFGDGSHLTGVSGNALLTSTQTWSGGNTFTSSITTVGQIHNSSATVNKLNAGQTWTNTTFDGIGIAGSTITVATLGGSIVYHYNGSCRNSDTNETVALAVYQDGSLVSPQTSTLGAVAMTNVTGAIVMNCSFAFYIRNPSAATHSYYMAGRVSAGTGSLTTASVGQAWVEELK